MQNWERILILILFIVLFVKFTVHEKFHGWIPISTRNTRNMSYDIRGDPLIYNKYTVPYRYKGYLGPFMYGLFPYLHMSPHHPFVNYRVLNN